MSTTASTGEGQVMLPPKEERFFDFLYVEEEPVVLTTSTNTGASEGRSASAGSSTVEGSSSAHADSHMRGKNSLVGSSAAHARSSLTGESENEMTGTSAASADMRGWSNSEQHGHAVAHQTGENAACTRGTDRSIARGNTVTNSTQATDGHSDTVGHTDSQGIAFTEGTTTTRGVSVAMTPFYEYRREDVETPVFLTPEEQKLLIMQRLENIPNQHAELIVPVRGDCFFRTPHTPAPQITTRRLAADHAYVYRTVPGYPPVALPPADISDADVEVYEVPEIQTPAALPSPAPDAEVEAGLWQRWTKMGRGRQEK
jgi:hypothetical protein